MNITKGQFRWVLTASIAAGILYILTSFIGESLLPEPLRHYLEAQSEAELTTREIVLAIASIPLLIVAVVSLIGLYCFSEVREVAQCDHFDCGRVFSIVTGPTVETGLGTALGGLVTMFEGFIIGLTYFSNARTWFEKPADGQIELER